MPHETTVAVFGSRKPKPGSEAYEAAYQLGREVALRGWMLCNGGYGGTMEASAKGAREAGGHVVGITCSLWGRTGINSYVDREVCTDNLYDRIRAFMDMCHAFVVLPGGTGTLLELALAWEMINKNLVKGKSLILLGDFWQSIADVVAQEDPRSIHCVQHAATAQEAVTLVARCH